MVSSGKMRATEHPGGVRELGMCGHTLHENRETSGCSRCGKEATLAGAMGKDRNRNPIAKTPEESDGEIVPKKPANKGLAEPAELAEGRAPTERNSRQGAVSRIQGREITLSGLSRVRQRAEADRASRFNNLFHFLKAELLRESFYKLKRNAASGVDGVTWQEYESNLEKRLPELERELHKGSYRAKPAKRTYIEKDDGRQRPIGVTTVEDKVVQQACVTILNEVFEPQFCGISYGFRPGRSQHDALDALHEGIIRRKINWVLDADIEGFFDNLDHEQLLSFIAERVADKRMIRLIRKWLRVGWVEDGKRHAGTVGTPQGGVISPLLANIYLHTVLDKWAQEWRRQARGDVIMVRYADDIIYGFQNESEARKFQTSLQERLKAYKLKQHPEKTRLIEFGRFAIENRSRRGDSKPETFDFLGFTHRCVKTQSGKYRIQRITISKRLRRKLREVKVELIKRMHDPLEKTREWLVKVVRGYTNYHAVPGNTRSIRAFYAQVARMWLWVIRRRSHKARSRWTWERFYRTQLQKIPRPRIIHPNPGTRFDAKYSR